MPAALLHHNASDVRVPFAAAAAIASLLSLYLLANGSANANSSSSELQALLGVRWGQGMAVPPMGLVSPDKLAALLRLFKYSLGVNGPPMYEALEGVACRCAADLRAQMASSVVRCLLCNGCRQLRGATRLLCWHMRAL